jgi:hypothetical protein
MSDPETQPEKKKGRPKKQDLVKNTPGKMLKRGRPPGEAAAMAEFKARILTSPKSAKVIEAIFNAALDDDHKNQAAAWKLLMERMVPVAEFEKGSSGGKPAVTINITGIGSAETTIEGEPEGEILDGEYEEEE